MRCTAIYLPAALSALLLVMDAHGANAAGPCAMCHATTAAAFQSNPHAQAPAGPTCADCHGDPAAHLTAPGSPGSIVTFATEPAGTINATCSGCHEDNHAPGPNAHSRAALSCTNCHSVHHETEPSELPADFKAVDAGTAVCFECHQDSFAQFSFNERHRLAEGSLSCSSCHDPHAPRGGARLGGFKQAMCTECHADAGGPYVFEHAASRVEGCTACHAPHGSPNRHMLTHQDVGALCYSCHAEVPQFHLGFSPVAPARFDERSVCTHCHGKIHGSNLDRLFLR